MATFLADSHMSLQNKNKRRPSSGSLASTRDEVQSNFRWAWSQLEGHNYIFLVVCVVAQAATILITWPAWQVRQSLPNLPWLASAPQFPVGEILLVSLVVVLISPKKLGVTIHLGILGISILMDQFRCQPQVFAIAFMTAACVWPTARRLCVWFLASMWLWTSIHKFASPDWFGTVSFKLLDSAGLNAAGLHVGFASIVALNELALGIAAVLRPKIAAIGCVAIHVGIAIFLFLIGWNYSVLPWNICTAIVGAWLLWNYDSMSDAAPSRKKASNPFFRLPIPSAVSGKIAIAILLLVPAGLYFGWVRHCFTHALYSGNLPIGLVTRQNETEVLESWKQLRFVFPNERKSYLDYFVLTAQPGDKLHIHEPRKFVTGGYFLLERHGLAKKITREHFFKPQVLLDGETVEVEGVACDDPRKIFHLLEANATLLKRSENEMVYAIKFDPETFDRTSLELIDGLPNLEQIQLSNCQIADEDLKWLSGFPKLTGIGFNGTPITDAGLLNLLDVPNLIMIEHENTDITDVGLIQIGVPIR